MKIEKLRTSWHQLGRTIISTRGMVAREVVHYYGVILRCKYCCNNVMGCVTLRTLCRVSAWSVADIRIVHVFVLSYTPYFHIVEWSTDDSKQDRYSHRISMHVVTSARACTFTILWRTLVVIIPRYGPVRVVQIFRQLLVDIKLYLKTKISLIHC